MALIWFTGHAKWLRWQEPLPRAPRLRSMVQNLAPQTHARSIVNSRSLAGLSARPLRQLARLLFDTSAPSMTPLPPSVVRWSDRRLQFCFRCAPDRDFHDLIPSRYLPHVWLRCFATSAWLRPLAPSLGSPHNRMKRRPWELVSRSPLEHDITSLPLQIPSRSPNESWELAIEPTRGKP